MGRIDQDVRLHPWASLRLPSHLRPPDGASGGREGHEVGSAGSHRRPRVRARRRRNMAGYSHAVADLQTDPLPEMGFREQDRLPVCSRGRYRDSFDVLMLWRVVSVTLIVHEVADLP